MAFSSQANRVRDSNRSMHYRVNCLNSCISALSFMIRPNYYELKAKYLPNKAKNFTEEELLAILRELEAMREQYHVQRKAFMQKRQAEKREGRRHPRRADLEAVGDVEIPPDKPANEETHAEI